MCVRDCGSKPAKSSPTGNLLLECVDAVANGFNVGGQLVECCDMGGTDCENFMNQADQTLTDNLQNIKGTAADYLQCVYDNQSGVQTCLAASMCVSLLTGGVGQGFENDFGVGVSQHQTSLYQISRSAQECSDMDPFGKRACDTVQGCCSECQPLIANVVHAVTNDLLLPAYNGNSLSNCPLKTCAELSSSPAKRRSLAEDTAEQEDQRTTEEEEEESTSTTGDDDFVGELAEECTTGMKNDILQYNETVAADNFLECLYKKMGKIAVKTADGSSSSTVMGAESSSAPKSFTAIAIAAALSTIVAVVV